MKQPIAVEGSFDWRRALVIFMAGYALLTLLRFYDTSLYSTLLINIGLPLVFVFAALLLVLGKSYASLDACMLIWLVAWVYLVESVHGWFSFSMYRSVFVDLIYYAFLCYPLARALPRKRRKPSLRLLLHTMHGAFLVMAALAVAMTMAGKAMQAPSDHTLGQMRHYSYRLAILMNPNNAGILCMLSILSCIYLAFSAKGRPEKAYCIASIIICGMALTLTDSRTAKLSTSAGVGVLGFVLAGGWVRPRWGALRGFFAGLGVALLLAAICYGFFSLCLLLLERTQMTPIDARSVIEGEGMTGRTTIWKEAMQAIRDKPSILLMGTGYYNILPTMTTYATDHYTHLHNAYLQLLMSAGLPALLMLLWFLARLFGRCVRLLMTTSQSVTVAERFMPGILLGCVMVSLTEPHFFITNFSCYNPFFFLIAGYIMTIAPEKAGAVKAAQIKGRRTV